MNNRQKAVKPLVDAYFAWVKEKYQPGKIDSSSYLLDQLKEYPRGEVPEDVLEALMPWSDKLPEDCRKTKSR